MTVPKVPRDVDKEFILTEQLGLVRSTKTVSQGPVLPRTLSESLVLFVWPGVHTTYDTVSQILGPRGERGISAYVKARVSGRKDTSPPRTTDVYRTREDGSLRLTV